MSDKKPLLEVKNLVTEFSSEGVLTKAVDDISFVLNEGETIGIVGESGSGKSVTSLSIMQLIQSPPGKIAGGEIIYHSKEGTVDLLKLPENKIRKYRGNEIAMIFQEPMTSLNPVFTCGYQVMESLILHKGMSKKEARIFTLNLFKKVNLPDAELKLDAYPHQLSGGQKQRVMIAMAIACEPKILIADEPTTALDVTVQSTILQLMRKLKGEISMSMIFITHDLGVIAEVADKVAVMYKGKIVEQGSVTDIFTNPKHPYTKGLLDCRPPLNKKLKRLPTISDYMNYDGVGTFSEKVESDTSDFKIEISEQQSSDRCIELQKQKPILEVINLSIWFPKSKSFFGKTKEFTKAVDDVSFDVYKGETLGLVGESGCGKTTLGRTILNLQPATNGEVYFKGKLISGLSHNEIMPVRENLQIIFQDPYSSLNPRMTIGNAILEPLTVHGKFQNLSERKEQVLSLMEKVSLKPEMYNRYPHEFSGGQRQRVCIARALSLKPEFIVCDESVSALDVSVQAQVLNLLLSLRDEFGFTYIFISHDLSVVKFMSDRMIVMNKGKIEESGEANFIYNNPKSEYTRKLIDAIPKGLHASNQKIKSVIN